MPDLEPVRWFHSHPPGPLCDRFEPHVHQADDSILIPGEKPGMVQSYRGCAPLIFWSMIGAGIWAVIIAAILKVLGR
jgi:hypothetical protein